MAKSWFIGWAEAQRAEARARYRELIAAAYLEAEEETRGAMLNARGVRGGIDTVSLFSGPEARAYAYASPELIEHWARRPRVTFAEYCAQTIQYGMVES